MTFIFAFNAVCLHRYVKKSNFRAPHFGRTRENAMETPVCTHKESLYKMGRGKVWTSKENLHLAEAWLEVSEDVGAPEVKGTNQDASEFWQRVENVFKAKAPSPNPSGQYNERAVSAIRNQWTEKVAIAKYLFLAGLATSRM